MIWEFKAIQGDIGEIGERLTDASAEGWEIVDISDREDSEGWSIFYNILLKREKVSGNNELTATRAEIARLTAELEQANKANAELTAKLKIADAGWSEAIDEVAELVAEIAVLKQDSGIPF